MTSQNAQEQEERDNPFAYLYPYEFILLTTFRKNGTGVPTAMWFAHKQGRLYMVTSHKSGKVKRIQNNGRALLAPCDMMGNILGSQIEASARELPPDQYAHANAILAEKYGKSMRWMVQKMMLGMMKPSLRLSLYRSHKTLAQGS